MKDSGENSVQYQLNFVADSVYFAKVLFSKSTFMKNLFTSFAALLMAGMFFTHYSAMGQEVLYSNHFNDPTGQLPPGWVLDGAQAPWSVASSAMAGGEAPELFLGFSFASGLSRLISPVINIEGHQELCLRFKQYLFNYEMDYGEIIGVDVTYDGGATWEALMEKPVGLLNIPQDEFSYYFTAPQGSGQLQFAFRFEGYNYAINFWAIDDLFVESPVDHDLLTGYFSGNTTPEAGEEQLYFLEVINGGAIAQQDYTVNLFSGDGTLLSTAAGLPVAFGEKMYHLFWWTPSTDNIGSMDIYAEIEFADDQHPDNNRTASLVIYVQPAGIEYVQIGSGSHPLNSLPCNFFNLHSYTQSLYLPEEVGVSGFPLTGLQYTCQFDADLEEVTVQILLGETAQPNLADNWINPATLTPVFNGTIDFSKGFNNLYIPLDNPYTYNGGNLVVQTVKSFSEMVVGAVFISSIDTGASRSRIAERDDMPFNPMTLPEFGYSVDYYPNITLFYSTGITSAEPALDLPVVSAYPNPVSSRLFVKSGERMTEVRITDLAGREILRENAVSQEHTLNVENLTPGLYLLQVKTAAGTATRKVQVLR